MQPKKTTRVRSLPSKTGAQRSRGKGFNSLEPVDMGFAMPEWMDAPAEGLSSNRASRTAEPRLGPETRSVVEGMKVVCICKGIKKRTFWNALDAGLCTREDINQHTGSGTGSCQGRRCGPRILEMLEQLR